MDHNLSIIKDNIAKWMLEKPDFTEKQVLNKIEHVVFSSNDFIGTNINEKDKLIIKAVQVISGYHCIQPLMDDDDISEIMINNQQVFFEKFGKVSKWEGEITQKEIELLIQRICEKSNRTINQLQPISDASLKGGIRTNIVLSPISVDGNVITIRKFPKNPITAFKLLETNFFDKRIMLFLKMLVAAKYNLFICGGAGSGKTTLLNVLTDFINPNERVITIEDSIELSITHINNLVRLESRLSNSEGKGEITIEQLIKSSLRMRPDRVIVGEVRGKEALDMLQAMNTGHDGSISTGHANSNEDMITRLETMVLYNQEIPISAIRQHIKNAIDIFIFVKRIGKRRILSDIAEVDKHQDILHLIPLFSFNNKQNNYQMLNEFTNVEKLERYSYE